VIRQGVPEKVEANSGRCSSTTNPEEEVMAPNSSHPYPIISSRNHKCRNGLHGPLGEKNQVSSSPTALANTPKSSTEFSPAIREWLDEQDYTFV
jgi:hypothetical protein